MTPTKAKGSSGPGARAAQETLSPTKESLRSSCGKPKRPPPITPRRFNKFFTPRATHKDTTRVRTSRRALQDITRSALNQKGPQPYPPLFGEKLPSIQERECSTPTRGKKRKLSFSSIPGSPRSSPVRRVQFTPCSSQASSDAHYGKHSLEIFDDEAGAEEEEEDDHVDPWQDKLPIRQWRKSWGGAAALLSRRTVGGRIQPVIQKAADWRDETSHFYTSPDDAHRCLSTSQEHHVLPFCAASCHTNSLIALGDEEGGIRIIDSSKKDDSDFSKTYVSLRPHDNAVMDLEFSSDDRLLATASGDQTIRVLDMFNQQEIYRLIGHTSSVKRVQFQPASNDKVVATCSRDGSIKIWDMRCSGTNYSVLQLQPSVPLDGQPIPADSRASYVPVLNTMRDAHVNRYHSFRKSLIPTRKEPLPRRDDVSVTTLAFLQAGREHLLASASEADACVKLWDMRTAYSSRGTAAMPIATTQAPASHESHRQFGITSMSFNTDCSRLYTVCRDHTVYAYSTSHLVLGHAPECLPNSNPHSSRRLNGSNLPGLGPLYGFRHSRFQVGSFYVKLSIRKPREGNTELLAVGSSDNCAILFPTSESYLDRLPKAYSSDPAPSRYRLRRNNSSSYSSITVPVGRDTPIYELGTALIEGHSKEVTGAAWTREGSLTTISDDFHARCWRENSNEARELRMSGGKGGRRWMSGWADVDESYDEDET